MSRALSERTIQAVVALLEPVLAALARPAGALSDASRHASARRTARRLSTDLRSAARSAALIDDVAQIVADLRASYREQVAVIALFESALTKVRAHDLALPASAGDVERYTMMALLTRTIEAVLVAAMARASVEVEITSHDAAQALKARLMRHIDAAVDRAADVGLEAMLPHLRSVAAEVVRDLDERGRAKPRIIDVDLPTALPAVVIAHRLYQDAGRHEEIAAQNAPPHPAFMSRVRVLSS